MIIRIYVGCVVFKTALLLCFIFTGTVKRGVVLFISIGISFCTHFDLISGFELQLQLKSTMFIVAGSLILWRVVGATRFFGIFTSGSHFPVM